MKVYKLSPAGDEEMYAACQYAVDTYLNESLYLVLRDQFFEP